MRQRSCKGGSVGILYMNENSLIVIEYISFAYLNSIDLILLYLFEYTIYAHVLYKSI